VQQSITLFFGRELKCGSYPILRSRIMGGFYVLGGMVKWGLPLSINCRKNRYEGLPLSYFFFC